MSLATSADFQQAARELTVRPSHPGRPPLSSVAGDRHLDGAVPCARRQTANHLAPASDYIAQDESDKLAPVQEGRHLPWLPLLGLLIGLWAIVPPYIVRFGELDVRSSVEFVDHAIPGAVVMFVAFLGYVQLRSTDPSQTQLLVGGGVIALAGFWMLSTHVGLIAEARQGDVPAGAVAWHGLPGLAVLLLGLVWAARFWGEGEASS